MEAPCGAAGVNGAEAKHRSRATCGERTYLERNRKSRTKSNGSRDSYSENSSLVSRSRPGIHRNATLSEPPAPAGPLKRLVGYLLILLQRVQRE